MIARITHLSVYVLDQDEALAFYVDKLGFKKHTDIPMHGGGRWLTVTAPEQPDLEVALMPTAPWGAWNAENAATMRNLVQQGLFGFAAFKCKDVRATYEELHAKGVEFTMPPTEQPFGIIAVLKDNSGNSFSLSELEPRRGKR
ncbi:MAG TPA: VOC family protein [Flavobacteriales bacterium]